MNHLDLCSGIGGFSLAARWIGWNTIQFVEIDKFCQKVLRKHWPEVPIHDDLKTFNATELNGRVGILTAGWPCQPFSGAGKRKGFEDPRHLWPEVRRVINECRPDYVCGENVIGHISLGLDTVLAEMEGDGYSARTVVIPACGKDAPHKRERIWIIAASDSYSKLRQQGRTAQSVLRQSQVSHIEPARGFAEFYDRWYSSAPRTCGNNDAIPNRVDRLRALGNAIVPGVAYEIFKAIAAAEAMND